jgi:hypothetical protein
MVTKHVEAIATYGKLVPFKMKSCKFKIGNHSRLEKTNLRTNYLSFAILNVSLSNKMKKKQKKKNTILERKC